MDLQQENKKMSKQREDTIGDSFLSLLNNFCEFIPKKLKETFKDPKHYLEKINEIIRKLENNSSKSSEKILESQDLQTWNIFCESVLNYKNTLEVCIPSFARNNPGKYEQPEMTQCLAGHLDIKGFTKMFTELASENMASFLQAILKPMLQIIDKYGGSTQIEKDYDGSKYKLEGDAICFVFSGNKEGLKNGIKAANEMKEIFPKLIEKTILPLLENSTDNRDSVFKALKQIGLRIGLAVGDVKIQQYKSDNRNEYVIQDTEEQTIKRAVQNEEGANEKLNFTDNNRVISALSIDNNVLSECKRYGLHITTKKNHDQNFYFIETCSINNDDTKINLNNSKQKDDSQIFTLEKIKKDLENIKELEKTVPHWKDPEIQWERREVCTMFFTFKDNQPLTNRMYKDINWILEPLGGYLLQQSSDGKFMVVFGMIAGVEYKVKNAITAAKIIQEKLREYGIKKLVVGGTMGSLSIVNLGTGLTVVGEEVNLAQRILVNANKKNLKPGIYISTENQQIESEIKDNFVTEDEERFKAKGFGDTTFQLLSIIDTNDSQKFIENPIKREKIIVDSKQKLEKFRRLIISGPCGYGKSCHIHSVIKDPDLSYQKILHINGTSQDKNLVKIIMPEIEADAIENIIDEKETLEKFMNTYIRKNKFQILVFTNYEQLDEFSKQYIGKIFDNKNLLGQDVKIIIEKRVNIKENEKKFESKINGLNRSEQKDLITNELRNSFHLKYDLPGTGNIVDIICRKLYIDNPKVLSKLISLLINQNIIFVAKKNKDTEELRLKDKELESFIKKNPFSGIESTTNLEFDKLMPIHQKALKIISLLSFNGQLSINRFKQIFLKKTTINNQDCDNLLKILQTREFIEIKNDQIYLIHTELQNNAHKKIIQKEKIKILEQALTFCRTKTESEENNHNKLNAYIAQATYHYKLAQETKREQGKLLIHYNKAIDCLSKALKLSTNFQTSFEISSLSFDISSYSDKRKLNINIYDLLIKLAEMYNILNQYEKAYDIIEKNVKTPIEKLLKNQDNQELLQKYAISVRVFGFCARNIGNTDIYREAIKLNQKVVKMIEDKNLDMDKDRWLVDIGDLLISLANCGGSQNELIEAEKYLMKIYDNLNKNNSEQIAPKNNRTIIETMNHLAKLHLLKGNNEKALKFAEKGLNIATQNEDNVDKAADILQNIPYYLGNIVNQNNEEQNKTNFEKAQNYFEKAQEIYNKHHFERLFIFTANNYTHFLSEYVTFIREKTNDKSNYEKILNELIEVTENIQEKFKYLGIIDLGVYGASLFNGGIGYLEKALYLKRNNGPDTDIQELYNTGIKYMEKAIEKTGWDQYTYIIDDYRNKFTLLDH